MKNKPITVAGILIAVFILGYFLLKSSPTASQDNLAADPMHSAPQLPGNLETLESLAGKPLPPIQLTDKDGKVHTMEDFKGKYTVLFFNEGLMCYPACWNQIVAFGSDQRFNTGDIQAISVVVDSREEWQRAIAKMPQLAKATTMHDVGAIASKQLGVLTTKSSMHRGSLPGHTYIIIDKNGIVRYVFDDPNMAIANDMLLKKIAELN